MGLKRVKREEREKFFTKIAKKFGSLRKKL